MLAKSRSFIIAAAFLGTSLAPALAQQNNPTGNMGSNRSMTATPGTADSKAASGVNSGDVGTHNYGAMTGTAPGHTKVPGNGSTMSGTAKATGTQKTESAASGGAGK